MSDADCAGLNRKAMSVIRLSLTKNIVFNILKELEDIEGNYGSVTLKGVKVVPSLKKKWVSVRQLVKEGHDVTFRDRQWKVLKENLVMAHRRKREGRAAEVQNQTDELDEGRTAKEIRRTGFLNSFNFEPFFCASSSNLRIFSRCLVFPGSATVWYHLVKMFVWLEMQTRQ
ncbi:unnamed protein product [Cuscuta campestris]|uniref:Uncharacterized protein n=1 Tax=Cuscuta campestris TaxID=132261 RepID=A0A484N5P1_9ASTE|nr:unnamed protein product [Cuscuta campestris]